MKICKRHFFLLCAIVLFFSTCPQLYAQKVGSTSMQFLKVMPTARGTALGEAYSVWATGAEAIFWNPAGMVKMDNMELSTSYVNWLFDSQQGALAYAFTIPGLGAFGVQLQYVDFGEFEETTFADPYYSNIENKGKTGRTFSPFSYLIGISYAKYLTNRFSVGISMKYVRESLFNGETVTAMVKKNVYEEVNTWADGLIFDIGIRYNTGFHSLHIGSAVQNFGADVTYAKESYPVPLLFRFGIGADLIGLDGLFTSDAQQNRLGIVADIFHPNDYAQQIHLGMEYEFAESFALRGGYKFNYDYGGLTLGVGFKYNTKTIGLSIDYSYGDMGTYLENVQRFSLGIILP